MPIQLYSSPMKYKDPNTGNYTNIIGISGNPGRGITSIVLNNNYTLTITYTDNTTTTLGPIRGDDGIGITSIVKTATSGLVDTYTITYTNNTVSTFEVTNGATPNFTIGTVTTGANAAATITGSAAAPVLNLTLPVAQGVPSGGVTGQVLKKKSGTDYDTEWANDNTQVSNNDFIVRLLHDPVEDIYTIDKTTLEIYDAACAGKRIVMIDEYDDNNPIYYYFDNAWSNSAMFYRLYLAGSGAGVNFCSIWREDSGEQDITFTNIILNGSEV